MNKPDLFKLQELVCPHVFEKYGETAWSFFDPRLLETIDFIRYRLSKIIIINNWHKNGQFSQRGLRCTRCELLRKAIDEGTLYASPHIFGQAVDFDVLGFTAQEVREILISDAAALPYHIRLEAEVSWVHLDVRATDHKVYLFKP